MNSSPLEPGKTPTLDERKAMVGSVRSRISILELDNKQFLGSISVDQFQEYTVNRDHPVETDPDGLLREWAPVINVTFRESRMRQFGLNPDLSKDREKLEIFLTGFAGISAAALKEGTDQLDFEPVFASFHYDKPGETNPYIEKVMSSSKLLELRKTYDEYMAEYRSS